jgi:hypothetical protein
MKKTNQEGIKMLCLIAHEQLQHFTKDEERRVIRDSERSYVIRTVLRRAVEKTSGPQRSNKQKCNYISNEVKLKLKGGLSEGDLKELVVDHMIPLSYFYNSFDERITVESLINKCKIYSNTCLITKEEDDSLNKGGYNKKSPDETDKFSRYKEVLIECKEITDSEKNLIKKITKKLSKHVFNKIAKLYKKDNPKSEELTYPKSNKPTNQIKLLAEKYNIEL